MKERLNDKGTLSALCIQCKQEFSISASEIEWYRQKGYSLPKRCSVCRRLRRIAISRDGHDTTHIVRREVNDEA